MYTWDFHISVKPSARSRPLARVVFRRRGPRKDKWSCPAATWGRVQSPGPWSPLRPPSSASSVCSRYHPAGWKQAASGLVPARKAPGMRRRRCVSEISVWEARPASTRVRVADADLSSAEAGLQAWLQADFTARWIIWANTGPSGFRPAELCTNTWSGDQREDVIPSGCRRCFENLRDGSRAYVSRYALGRDYHKVLRVRCSSSPAASLHRVLTDTACSWIGAPVMEGRAGRPCGTRLARKHSRLDRPQRGFDVLLGEIYTDLPFGGRRAGAGALRFVPRLPRRSSHRRDRGALPVDARLCISLSHHRTARGRFLCPCARCWATRGLWLRRRQLVCPWNRFARLSKGGFLRCANGPDQATLAELFHWARPISTNVRPAVRSIGSVTSAGCAIWRSAWAMRSPRRVCFARLRSRRGGPFGAGARPRGLGACPSTWGDDDVGIAAAEWIQLLSIKRSRIY